MNTAINNNLPILSNEGGLSAYLEQIKKFPMLDAEEEYMLAKNWKTTGNIKAAEKLVTSHLRLVAKIAMGYKGYGLPVNEMISEGNIGLMQAVKKFEPEKGFRLANLKPFSGSNFFTACIKPILPSEIISLTGKPYPLYPIAIFATNLK